jgi:hypothetical protein
MRKEPLLTAVPPVPVRGLSELYAIALDQAQKAARQYGSLAARTDERLLPLRAVFDEVAARERQRSDDLSAACLAACGKRPDASDLRWAPIDLIPAAEMTDIGSSSLSTPYTAWALAARHRQRAFVFWTYVIALAEDALVRKTAEQLAHAALSDGDLLRRERRLAWRAERKIGAEDAAKSDGGIDEAGSAALLESLLLRDMMAWSQRLDPVQREQLSTLDPAPLPPPLLTPSDGNDTGTKIEEVEQIKGRALRRAEQLSNIYLDDADRAADQNSMELAQKLAAQSIMRLAGLRHLASQSATVRKPSG